MDSKITFRPRADVVMVEIGKREPEGKIILPESAKNRDDVLLTVRAVGAEVKGFKAGDVVMCAPNTNTFKLDAGDGDKTYMFATEEEVFGVFGE